MDPQATAGTTPNTGDATGATPTTAAATPATGAPAATTQQTSTAQPAAPAAATPAPASTQLTAETKPAVPEKYEFTAPEGTKLTETIIGEFSTVVKEMGLSQEAAQNLFSKLAPVYAKEYAAQQAEQFTSYKTELETLSKADKEFGGDKLNENLAVAKKALDTLGTPALRELLDVSGLGNHPELIRYFFRTGKAISEDKFVPGGKQPPAATKSQAEALYGKP